jgi:8-oxo-dGTP diphosphatase
MEIESLILKRRNKMSTERPMTQRLQQSRNTDYNLRRKQRAIAAQEQPTSPVPELAYDLETPEGQIAYFRQKLAQAKDPLTQASQKLAIRKRTRETAFIPRKTRLEQRKQRAEISSELGKLKAQEKAAEYEIARKIPEQAKPEYKQQALEEAKSSIQSKINILQENIERATAEKRAYERTENPLGDALREYQKGIDLYRVEINEYKKAIGKDTNTLIKDWFSGYTENTANYERDKVRSRIEQRAAFERAKKTDPQLKEIIQVLNLPTSVSQVEMQKALVEQQKQAQNQIKDWQKSNPTEKLLLDNTGAIIGVQSGKLGMSVPIANYNKLLPKTSSQQLLNMALSSKSNVGTSSISNLLANNASSRNMGTITSFGISGDTDLLGNKTDLSKIKQGASKVYQKGKEVVGDVWNFLGEKTPFLGEKTPEIKIPIFTISGGGGGIPIKDIKKWAKTVEEELLSGQLDKAIQNVNSKEKELLTLQNKLNSYPILGGNFVGNQEQYNQYQKDFSNYEKKYNEYTNSFKIYEDKAKQIKDLTGVDVIKQGVAGLALRSVQLLPETFGQAAVASAGAYGAWRYAGVPLVKLTNLVSGTTAGKVALTGTDIYFGVQGVKGFRDTSLTPGQRTLSLGVGALSGYSVLDDLSGLVRSIPKGTGRVSKITTESKTLPYVRKRATVIIEDSKGNVLYHVDKNTGLSILPGGAIDKGETALNAAKRELYEETGLRLSLKKFDKVITEREANYIYKATVNDLNKLIPTLTAQAKEVAGFRAINPGTYTGKTQLSVFGSKGVRAEDLYIGSRSKVIKEINQQISRLTPTQKQALINQAKQEMVRIYGKQALMLSKENLLKEYLLLRRGMQYRGLYIRPVEQTFTRRGQPVFLKRRVKKPTLKEPSSIVDLLTGRKPGQFKRFQKEAPISVGFGSRYDVPFKRLREYEDNLVTYLHGTPGQIKKDTDIYAELIAGKPVPRVDETFKVLAKKGKRGEKVLYFQPPTTPTGEEAYIGASYLGLIKKQPRLSDEIKIGFGRVKPTIYRIKAQAGKDLIYTRKAIAGTEFEVGAKAGTVFKVTGKSEFVNLAGKRVKIQNIELKSAGKGLTENQIQNGLSNLNRMNKQQRISFLNKVKRETGRDYYYLSGRYDLDPIQAVNQVMLPAKKQPEKREAVKERISEQRSYERMDEIIIRKPSVKYSGISKPKERQIPSRIRYREINNYLVPEVRYKPKEKEKTLKTPYKPKEPYYRTPPYDPLRIIIPRAPVKAIKGTQRPKPRGVRIRKEKKKYETLPTITELIMGGVRGKKPRVQIRGFELTRFR